MLANDYFRRVIPPEVGVAKKAIQKGQKCSLAVGIPHQTIFQGPLGLWFGLWLGLGVTYVLSDQVSQGRM